MIKGACLCGAVAFSLKGKARDILGCHCGQCRKQSGFFWAATSVADENLNLEIDEGLKWFQASNTARRGFCRVCGSSLFWKPEDAPRIVVAAGALEAGHGLRMTCHVFLEDKGDYYKITDGLPQFERFSGGENA